MIPITPIAEFTFFADAAFSPMLASIRVIGLGAVMAVVSAIGVFASNERLIGMAGIIGTKNPKVARIVCAIGLILGILFTIVGVADEMGMMK